MLHARSGVGFLTAVQKSLNVADLQSSQTVKILIKSKDCKKHLSRLVCTATVLVTNSRTPHRYSAKRSNSSSVAKVAAVRLPQ